MSAQLPCPSASAGAAMSSHAVIRGKMGIATQRQREWAMLVAQVDKSREPAIDKTRAFIRAAPATPSSIECAHRLLQRSAMKQVDVPLVQYPVSDFRTAGGNDSRTLSNRRGFGTASQNSRIPPTVERVAGGEHVVGGG